MICSYARQTWHDSPFYYFDGPEGFDVLPKNCPCYKNIVFLMRPEKGEEDFNIHSVGYEVADPQKSIINRIYPEHMILHYVVGGKGSFNGKSVKKGDCFVSFCGKPHSIGSHADDVLKFYWVMFKPLSGHTPEMFGLNGNTEIFSYGFEDEMERILKSMLYFKSEERDTHCFFMSKFYELISFHKARAGSTVAQHNYDAYDDYIDHAKRMWEQTSYMLSVQDVARSLGFSRKHFSRIFKDRTHFLPQQYIVYNKILLAKRSMEAGENNLKIISDQLGYGDYPSFFRAFKKQTGMTPKEYLEKIKHR